MENNTNLKTSKQAIASLTLSILWLLGIGSLIAIVLGHKARADIKKNSETLKGKGIALAGLILGYLGIILSLFAFLVAPLGVPRIYAASENLKVDLTCLNMATARRTLDLFMLDNGTYPTNEEGLNALIKNPNPTKYPDYSSKAYLKELPKDAWRTPFVYLNNQGKIELISLGADKKEAGEDYAKDIFYSECKK